MNRWILTGMLCLALCAMLCAAEAASVETYGLVRTRAVEEMADLREGPSEDSKLIASYFSGVFYELDDAVYAESDGWVYVTIESLQSGYMREEFLVALSEVDETGYPSLNAIEMGTIRVPEGEDSARFSGLFSSGFAQLPFYDGTRAKLLGVSEEGIWHVNIGNVNGHIDGKCIERAKAPNHLFYGFIPEGYAVITDPSVGSGDFSPFPVSLGTLQWSREANGDLFHRTFPFLSASDQEAQLSYAAHQGFAPMDFLALFPMDALFIDGEAVSAGTYTAGQDLTPGLYTLTATAGQSGLLEMETEGGKRTYRAEGESAYTVHISDGMRIALENGTLTPTPQASQFTLDERTISGSGRLFIYPDFGSTFSVNALEGDEKAHYMRTNLLYDTGEAEALQKITLEPGEESGILLFPGEFIEFENCLVRAEFGNG